MLSKLKNTFAPITNLSEWVRHSFCALRASTFRCYESSSRPSEEAISPNGLNGVPQAAKRSLPTARPFSPDQTRHLCRTTSHSPLVHGISPPPAIVLPSLMVLPIIESSSRLFNYLPMPAFVGADAAKALRILESFNMLLNRTTGNSCCRNHFSEGDLWIAANQLQEPIDSFLTTFSYHLATRLSPSVSEGSCRA